MKFARSLAIAGVIAATAAPLAASAQTTYTFSIPVQLTNMQPARYQFWCSVGGAAIPAQPGVPNMMLPSVFNIASGSYTGTVSAVPVKSATVQRTYDCVLYRIVTSTMRNPMTGVTMPSSFFATTPVKVSGTM